MDKTSAQSVLQKATNTIVKNLLEDKWEVEKIAIENNNARKLSVTFTVVVPDANCAQTDFVFIEGKEEKELYFFERVIEKVGLWGGECNLKHSEAVHTPISKKTFMSLRTKYTDWTSRRSNDDLNNLLKTLKKYN